MMESLRDLSVELIEMNPNISTEAAEAIKGIDRLGFLVNFIGSTCRLRSRTNRAFSRRST